MNTQSVILADLDEILFETRDKEYGAYQLRKKSRNFLMIAAVTAMVIFTLGSTGPMLYNLIFSGAGDADSNINKNVVVTAIDLNIPPPPEDAPPPLDIPPPKISSIEFRVPEPKPDEEVVEDETMHEIEEIEEAVTVGTEDVEGADEGYAFGEIEGKGTATVEVEPEPDPNAFIMVEKEPAPVNMENIKKLIGYPPPAKEAGLQGKVVVRILVGPDGKYVRHIVLKNPHPILTKAVEEQLKNIQFTPGIQAGRPIKVWVNIPFDFRLGG